FAANSVSFAGPVRKREKHQQKRIEQGVQSGQLTSREAKHLEKGEARIENERERMLKDGKLTPKEAKKLTHDQNVLSKKIYHEKHDNQVREGVTPE
ncbi:MAG: hypothetical protein HZC17_07115, partial [Candidatus Omnitrophica bacterium]|nr:hypothetical protein [Candidatus Omnitrophota bacterium]